MSEYLDDQALLALCLLILRRRRRRRLRWNAVQENQAAAVQENQPQGSVVPENRDPGRPQSAAPEKPKLPAKRKLPNQLLPCKRKPVVPGTPSPEIPGKLNMEAHEKPVAQEATKEGMPKRLRKYWIHPSLADTSARTNSKIFHDSLREDPDKFREHYQLSVGCFDDILARIEKAITGTDTFMREALNPETKLAATLRYLATGNTYTMIAEEFHIGRSTVSIITRSVCNALWAILKRPFIGEPSVDDFLKISEDYERNTDFPHCLGSVGGRYVDVSGYKQESDLFKATSLGSKVFSKSLDLPEPTKVPDIPDPLPYVFVSNDFHQSESVLRPFQPRNLPPEKSLYNDRLDKAVAPLDSALTLLTNKWKILQRPFEMAVESTEAILKACCVLHNYLGEREGFPSIDGMAPCGFDRVEPGQRSSSSGGASVRSLFVNYLNSSTQKNPQSGEDTLL